MEFGIPGVVLMENAGRCAAAIIRELILSAKATRAGAGKGAREDPRDASGEECLQEPIDVLCGPGNNGGDGFVVARYLLGAGVAVRVHIVRGTEYRPGSDSATNLAILVRLGVRPAEIDGPQDLPADTGAYVDALFGTGLARPLRSPHLEIVEALDRAGRPTVSLDIPSGLDADTGEVLGAAVRALYTITFASAKLGFARASGPGRCGRIHIVDIGLPRALWAPGDGS